jgi:hypothetical protein
VNWSEAAGMVSKPEFFETLRHSDLVERVERVETVPHFPAVPGYCYLHQDVSPGDGSKLAGLLDMFFPATPEDRELIKAFFLTLFWGGPPGARPMFAILPDGESHGQGTGKTTLVKAAAELVGGSIDFSKPPDSADEVQKRLLSDGAKDIRLVLMDNVKVALFHWDELEILITAKTISGRKLYEGEGRRPNSLVYVLTSNDTRVGRDMAERVRVIRLMKPTYTAEWESNLFSYLENFRWGIIQDIAAEFAKSAQNVAEPTRWAAWDKEVLGRVGNPDACQDLIKKRLDDLNDSETEVEYVRDHIMEQLKLHEYRPGRDVFFVVPSIMVPWIQTVTGKKLSHNAAMRYLYTLKIPGTANYKLKHERGCLWWVGRESPDGVDPRVLRLRKE